MCEVSTYLDNIRQVRVAMTLVFAAVVFCTITYTYKSVALTHHLHWIEDVNKEQYFKKHKPTDGPLIFINKTINKHSPSDVMEGHGSREHVISNAFHRMFPDPRVGRGRSWLNVTTVHDFFNHFKTLQTSCKKLLSLGGHSCNGRQDGQKLVCVDLLPRVPTSCLVYSYGVHYDISFDRAAAGLGCSVNMFDISSYGHKAQPRLTFHHMGVHHHQAHVHFPDQNMTIIVNTVGGHMLQLGHLGQDLHILKVDVEGSEWPMLEELVTSPLLDYVGQIALEIHLNEIIHLNLSQTLLLLQDRAAALSKLESRGFLLAAYWDNPDPSSIFIHTDGSSIHTCGEALYINYNWIHNNTRTATEDLIQHYQTQPPPVQIEGKLIGALPPFE